MTDNEKDKLIEELTLKVTGLQNKSRALDKINDDHMEEIMRLESDLKPFKDSKKSYCGLLFLLCKRMAKYKGDPHKLEKLLTENNII